MFDESNPEPATQNVTENHTKFHPDDADTVTDERLDGTATFEQHYARLASHNVGIYNGKWADKTQLRRQDNLAVFDAIGGYLDLTTYQKETGRQAFDDLNLRKLSSPGGIDTPLVAVMVAAVVTRRDGRTYHPQANEESNDALFTALLDDLAYDDSVLHSAFGKVYYQLEVAP
jgi:hypothetical protein